MATLEELHQQLAALSARVDALTTPPDDYYTSKYSGEEIDAGIKRTESLPESWPLPVASGGTGADTAQLALANLGGRPNRNLARNPDFRINQRGFSSADWRSGYGPDGWQSAGAGSLEYSGGAVKTNNQYLLQFYELGEVEAGIYTISALCSDNIAGDFGFWGGKASSYQSTNYENGFASATIEITQDMVDSTKNPYLYIMSKHNGSISRIKVEKSPIQTMAYKDHNGQWVTFETLDNREELARCQRYLYKVATNRNLFGSTSGAGDSVILTVDLPVEMRTTPVITDFKNCYIRHTGGQYGAVTPSVRNIDKIGNQVIFQFDNPDRTNIKGGTPLIAFATSDWFISAEF